MASELFVTEAAVKQHLLNLYDKFAIPTEGDRRVRLANEALRRGAVTIAQLRDSGDAKSKLHEVERLDGRDRHLHGWAGRRRRCSRRSSRRRRPPRRAPAC